MLSLLFGTVFASSGTHTCGNKSFEPNQGLLAMLKTLLYILFQIVPDTKKSGEYFSKQ